MREPHGRFDPVRKSVVEANGTRLCHEVRGDGSPVLFISGATGDAGHFAHVADALSDGFRVITYDRRANSRSPRPRGWTQTSITEQADDAAALLEAVATTPAVVFGTSGGGTILMELICRHSVVLKGALAHEPVLMSGGRGARARPKRVPRSSGCTKKASRKDLEAEKHFGVVEHSLAKVVIHCLEDGVRARPQFLSYVPDMDVIRGAAGDKPMPPGLMD